jgi:hypothetical protein
MNLSTVYQNLKEDWRKEGQQEGENIAMKKVAIVLLREGSTIDLVQKVTGLTIVQIQQLRDRLATGETPDSIIR